MAGGFEEHGEDEALDSLEGLADRFRAGLTDAAEMGGQLLVRVTQEGMNSAGGGRTYPGQRRQSSAPGGYPAVQSGQLIGSLAYEVEGPSALHFGSRGAFNRGFDYAIGQHEGTSKMAPRPYLHLTVNATSAELEALMGQTVWQKIVGG